MRELRQALQEEKLYLDGGMGTLLQEMGLKPGEDPETWNLLYPERIRGIHLDYYNAGSNIVNTNTFGANVLRFSEEELREIIFAGVKIAKEASMLSENPGDKWVALDVGPTGKMLKPYGDLDFEDAVTIFKKTIQLGVEAGADLIMIETMNDSYETKAALLAAKETCDLPVFVSNAYGADGKLMTGADAKAMVAMLEGLHADAIGVNCSLGPEQLAPVVREYLKYASVPVLLKPNAGLPKVIDGKTIYNVGPEEFSTAVKELILEGVRISGGCCGTTPAYIKALFKKTKDITPVPLTEKTETFVSSYTHAVEIGPDPILIGERINPTGKKRFKQALIDHDISYILNEGIKEQEKGVHVLDVNVGLPDSDEVQMLTEVVFELQAVSDLPLQIDTSDPVAMEQALRRYNGKPMVNSVNGKEENLKEILPLVKKYGGVLVSLTLDEAGIPETSEGRFKIAEKIISEAAKYGIKKKDLIFDTLTMTVSAGKEAAKITLDALKRVHDELSVNTVLGVSNVSFGLPNRDLINGTFFSLALNAGLSAAIMNPMSAEMMKAYFTFRALSALDENLSDYINFASTYEPAAAKTKPGAVNAPSASKEAVTDDFTPLMKAVISGLKDDARKLTKALLETEEPLGVIQSHVIPALNTVGERFEKKTVYLPQLLMSAEAASVSFEEVKQKMALSDTKQEVKCPFVIATVKGDIHDIGKNIVKLLLENYGFAVSDLGRDVPPETVLEEVLRLHAPIAGLSALMTTTVPSMEETIQLLHEKAPFCKVIVGGAVLTEDYAKRIGADFYAKDAMETVRISEKLNEELV